jgi:parallel beta helix pectate lyase-like protein
VTLKPPTPPNAPLEGWFIVQALGYGGGDDTPGFVSAIAASNLIWVPKPAGSYRITEKVTVPAGKTIAGPGAQLVVEDATSQCFDVTGDDVTFMGLYFDGPYNPMTAWPTGGPARVARAESCAITARAPDVGHPIRRLTVEGCRFRYFGGSGIWTWHLWDSDLEDNVFEMCGRDGIRDYSPQRNNYFRNEFRDIGPGYDGVAGFTNAYAITTTRASHLDGGSLIAQPVPQDCLFAFNEIDGVPTWAGFGTHGGRRLTYFANTVRRCFLAIATDDGDSDVDPLIKSPLEDITIVGNTFDAGALTNTGPAVFITSSDATSLARRITITGNTIKGHGSNNTAFAGNAWGAIFVSMSTDVTIANNNFTGSSAANVWIEGTCRGIKVLGNSFRVVAAVAGIGYAIYVEDSTVSATIDGNSHVRDSGEAAYTAYSFPAPSAGHAIKVGAGEIFNGTITKWAGSSGSNVAGGSLLTGAKAWARVTVSAGVATLVAGYNIQSITYVSAGRVGIKLLEDAVSATGYAPLVTPISGSDRKAAVNSSGIGVEDFEVLTRDTAGTLTDTSFSLQVFGV